MAATQLASAAHGRIGCLVVVHWFGFTASKIPESIQNSLLNIVMVGVGDYVTVAH